MQDDRQPTVRWLTIAAWASLLVFALTSTLGAVSLKHIGADLQIGFGLKGALAPVRSLVLALSTFAVGYWGDRTGKRRFLVGGMCIVAFGLFWVGRSRGYVTLALGMMTVGMGLGCLEGLVSPLIAELHPRKVAMHMNVLHAFFPAGIVVSSLVVGSALDRGVPWRMPFTVAAVPALLIAAMFMAGRYPAAGRGLRPPPLRVRDIAGKGVFWLLACAQFLTAGAEGAIIYWSPNFIQDEYATPALIGAFGLMSFTAAMALGRFGTGVAVRFVPLSRLMMPMAFLGAGVTLCLALVASLWVSLTALALAGLLVACFWPSILSTATSRIGAGSATLLAMLAVAGIAGFGGIPLVVGVLAEFWGLRVGLLVVPATLLAAGAVLMAVFATPPPRRPS